MTTPNGTASEKSKSLKFRNNIFYKLFHKKKSQKQKEDDIFLYEEDIENLDQPSNLSVNNRYDSKNVIPSCNEIKSITDDRLNSSIKQVILPTHEPSITDSLKKARHLFFESLSCHDSDIGDLSITSHDNSFQLYNNTVLPNQHIRNDEYGMSKKPIYGRDILLAIDNDGFVKIEAHVYKQLLEDLSYLKSQLTNLQLLLQYPILDTSPTNKTPK